MKRAPAEWRPQLEQSLLLSAAMAFARLLNPFLRLARVDIGLFRTLLETRLTLDLKGDAESGHSSGAAVGPTLVILAAWLGGLVSGVAALMSSPMIFMLTAHSLLMWGLGMLLVLQLSVILVDAVDFGVIAALPVDGRTLFASRLAHAFLYVVVLSTAYSLFPVLLSCVGFRAWQPLLVFPLTALLSGTLTLGLVAVLHAICLKIIGPVRFQRIIAWVQFAIISLMMGGYQIVLRIFPVADITEFVLGHPELVWVIPPAHFGGLLQVSRETLGRGPWVSQAWP